MRFPSGIKLVAGMTATVQIEPYQGAAGLRFETRACGREPGRRAASFVPDADRRVAADRPFGRRQTGGDAVSVRPRNPSIRQRRKRLSRSPRSSRPQSSVVAIGDAQPHRRTVSVRSALAGGHAAADAAPPISRRSNSRSPLSRPGRSRASRQERRRNAARANILGRPMTFSAVKARRPRRNRGLPTRSAGAPARGGAICRRDRRSCTAGSCGSNHLAVLSSPAIAHSAFDRLAPGHV